MSETETERRLRDTLAVVDTVLVGDGRAAVDRARATATRRSAQRRARLTIAAASVAVCAVVISGVWIAASRRSPAVTTSPIAVPETVSNATPTVAGPTPSSGDQPAAVVSVPNIVGMDSDQARTTVENDGLTYREESIYSNSPKGRIDRQVPVDGASVTSGSTVVAYISQGPEMAVVPEAGTVVGLTVGQATAALEAAGFTVQVRDQASPLPKGQVLSMDLRPGSEVQAGTTVTLTVSDNSLMVTPDLTKMTPDQALAALKQAGWTGDDRALVTTTLEDPEQALWGHILTQQPAAGDPVPKTSAVAVTIAAEPHIVVPDLSDKTIDQAYQALTAVGWYGQLEVTVHKELTPPTGRANLIYRQSPAPTIRTSVSSTITVDVYPPGG